jgi:hypothetical protein
MVFFSLLLLLVPLGKAENLPEDETMPETVLSSQVGQETELENQILDLKGKIKLTEKELAGLRQGLNATRDAIKTERASLSIKSDARGMISYSTAGGWLPYIFNALRIYPRPDSVSRLSVMLYMQDGMGNSQDHITRLHDREFSLSTQLPVGQGVRLTLGDIWYSSTPFLFYKASRESALDKDPNAALKGILLNAMAFGSNWNILLSKQRSGYGKAYDKYLLHTKTALPIKGGSLGLSLFSSFDDRSSVQQERAFSASNTIGVDYNFGGRLWSQEIRLNGEGQLNIASSNITGNENRSLNYALKMNGSSKNMPVGFNFYLVSADYPTAGTAIRPLTEDFIYRWEEDPLEPDYLGNSCWLKIQSGQLSVKDWGKAVLEFERGRELVSDSGTARNFAYRGLDWTGKLTLPSIASAEASASVEYFDEGTGQLVLEYDSNYGDSQSAIYRQAGVVNLTDSKTWKTASFKLNNVAFRGRQKGGTDFRLWAMGQQQILVGKVAVSKESDQSSVWNDQGKRSRDRLYLYTGIADGWNGQVRQIGGRVVVATNSAHPYLYYNVDDGYLYIQAPKGLAYGLKLAEYLNKGSDLDAREKIADLSVLPAAVGDLTLKVGFRISDFGGIVAGSGVLEKELLPYVNVDWNFKSGYLLSWYYGSGLYETAGLKSDLKRQQIKLSAALWQNLSLTMRYNMRRKGTEPDTSFSLQYKSGF